MIFSSSFCETCLFVHSASWVWWSECHLLSHFGMLKSIAKKQWVLQKIDGDDGLYRLCSCSTTKMAAFSMRCFYGNKMLTKNLMAWSHVLFATLSSASRPIKCPTWNARLVTTDFTPHVSWSGFKALANLYVFFASSLGRAVKFSDVRELIGSDTEKNRR